nr:ModD protein [uncultured Holophaga sp.]
MSFFIPDSDIDRIIEEDVHPLDLTSHLLGMDRFQAEITYAPRTPVILACTEEVERICTRLGLAVELCLPTGTPCEAGQVCLRAHGRADRVHLAWRTGMRVLESFCAVATRTADFVRKARGLRPDISVVTTRKNMPGTRHLAIKAVMAGGAYPHRLGLSETVLIFDAHIELFGGLERFLGELPAIRQNALEKKIGAEAKTEEEALAFARAGLDFIQLDKLPPEAVTPVVSKVKAIHPGITVVAAGNINPTNVEAYAASGADVLVTSSLYFGPPADIKATIRPLDDKR